MMFIDLEELGAPSSFEADLCIAGSGPAGVSIAKEFAGSKVQVLIIEGGGIKQSPADQAPSDVENMEPMPDTPQDLLRNRIVGGYSHIWGGRCVSLDDIDFESRGWIPDSGWPLLPQDVHPFLDRSKKYFGIGPNIYDDRLWKELGISPPRPRIDPALLQSKFWQYSSDERDSREPTRFFRTIAKINAANLRLLMHANITHINTSEDGARVKSLEVRTLDGRRAEVKANTVVLACGGLENARLLLASNKIASKGVGNSHDLVGRFLMLHPGCKLGWFDPRRSAPIQRRFGHYLLDHGGGKNVYAFGLMLSPEIQRKERLLNCAALLEKAPSTDEAWNALRRLVTRGADRRRTSIAKDVANVVGHLPSVLSNAYRRVARR
jgi:choline dehydrogenase-like flavoprotein